MDSLFLAAGKLGVISREVELLSNMDLTNAVNAYAIIRRDMLQIRMPLRKLWNIGTTACGATYG